MSDPAATAAAPALAGAADPLLIALGVLVTLGMLASPIVYADYTESKRRRHRLEVYVQKKDAKSDKGDRSDLKRKQIQNKLKALTESKRHGKSHIGAARRYLLQAGLEVPLHQFWMGCGAVGFLAALFWLVTGDQPLLAPVIFLGATFMIPKLVLGFLAGRRQKAFTKHFSDAVDVLVRGLKSGLPVGECFRIIARESPDPVGHEFRIVMDEVNAGLTMEEALDRCHERMPTQELKFFATVIAVQQQTGGNLAEILSSISNVLRGRAQLKEKVKALSGEARASSLIIGSLPFIIGTVLFFINHDYVATLWTVRSGKILLATAIGMLSLGVFIMNRMGKLD